MASIHFDIRWKSIRVAIYNASIVLGLVVFGCIASCGQMRGEAVTHSTSRSDSLVNFNGPWASELRGASIILVSDKELEILAQDPDRKINLATSHTPRVESLRDICEREQKQGEKTLTIAYDQFFAQYRGGQKTPRLLKPDSARYIQLMGEVSRFASNYGIGLDLSLLSPLELGGETYRKDTGDSGVWMQYREGFRNPVTGAFSVQLWRESQWTNNKGVIKLEDAGIRAFAFHETPAASGDYRAVNPDDIQEIKTGIHVESLGQPDSSDRSGVGAVRVRVYGTGSVVRKGLDRILIVQIYKTPEMDYFSPRTLPYLNHLVDRYAAAGIKLNALYSDEMHIQQDWHYFNHQDNGEFNMRYVSPGLVKEYADKYGAQYRDFAKYLVYFVHGQEDVATDLSAKQEIMLTFGSSQDAVQQTALFRARYYRMLQDGVVDLFVQAKQHAEKVMGHSLPARAHATWAESPTIDFWRSSATTTGKARYEYTPDFVWSNTVQQAAAACADYFKWGDYLTGNGNDFAEGGWLDRDYYGLAMAASTGILNRVPNSYAAHWGDPKPISEMRSALEDVYGDGPSVPFAVVENMQPRDTHVLMLYPLDLVAEDERFGSWMVQYGYTDYVTDAKLLERSKIVGNKIEMGGRYFTTLVVTFEPFPSTRLLQMMKEFTDHHGRLIWSGPPPILTAEGGPALKMWSDIFGVDYQSPIPHGIMWRQFNGGIEKAPYEYGRMEPGSVVKFNGVLAKVPPQTILTSFLVDHTYPVVPRKGTMTIARVKGDVIGTERGSAVFLGYRPRDDQSDSLGHDERNLFDVLDALGAYPPSGVFKGVNDNPDYISRTGHYMATVFPNGAVAIAPHLRHIEETWDGGFARDPEKDREYLKAFPPPSDALNLNRYEVAGYSITYNGNYAVAFRVDASGELIAFAGRRSDEVKIDGKSWRFADAPIEAIAWGPVEADRRVNPKVRIQIEVNGTGKVRIPARGFQLGLHLYLEGQTPGSQGQPIPSSMIDGYLVFTANQTYAGHRIYGVEP